MKNKTHSLCFSTLAMLTAIGTSACDSMRDQPSVSVNNADMAMSDMPGSDMGSMSSRSQSFVPTSSLDRAGGGGQSVDLSPYYNRANVAQTLSNENVTIFSLDGAAAQGGNLAYPTNPGAAYATAGNYTPVATNDPNVMARIFFKHGSSRLGSIDRQRLAAAAEEAKFMPVDRIAVEGYASNPTGYVDNSVRGHLANLRQSMNRSYKVSQDLIENGLPAEKIKMVSWGSTRATGDESFDRRVDVRPSDR